MNCRNKYHPYYSITLLLAIALLNSGYWIKRLHNNNEPSNIAIKFFHTVGQKPFSQDSNYVNDFGEQYTVNRFRYYVSNICWHNSKTGKDYKVPDSYFLIDEAEPLSKQIGMTIPAGLYSSVSFLVGIDSLKNVSGAQDGVMDPINGMFWTWQTGYIMAKLEGSSPVSTLPRRMFEFHIGGFKGTNNVLQKIELPLLQSIRITEKGKQRLVTVSVDINKWFNGKHPLPIAKFPACTTPGQTAFQFAENYHSMFSINKTK